MARSSGSAELQRPSEILHQGHARGSVAMRANDVVDPVALPVDEHMSNVCTLAMPSGSFNQGTVGRTSVDRGGRSEHSERCESHAAYARSRTAIAHWPGVDDHVPDRRAVNADECSRRVEPDPF